MSLFPTAPKLQRKTVSLARHIFVRVAFPVGIVFLSCFSLLDQLVQKQLRNHIKQELIARDVQNHQVHLAGESRLQRSLGALAEGAGISAALLRGDRNLPAQLTQQMRDLGPLIDEDVYAFAGLDRKLVLTLRRNGSDLSPTNEPALVPTERTLAELDGDYYFLTSYPLERDGKPAGWMVAGRQWLRDMPIGENWYVLAQDGKVLQTAGLQQSGVVPAGFQLPGCEAGKSDCEVEISGHRELLLRSAASGSRSGIDVYLVQSFDTWASPILGIMRNLMFTGALLSILGAFGMTLLTGRAIASPLRDITLSCARAEESGQLSDIELPQSRIAEVTALAQTLQGAVRSIEDGQNKLNQAYFQFMGAIVAMLDARDTYTAGHSHRVSAYSEALARDFGLPQEQIDDIRIGALLHDIGKIGVPDEILGKHERLTNEEFDLMKQHPTIGRKVLEQVVQFEKYLDAVELHHENLDGTGYPRGLKGEQIPLSARIVKVADVYDALSTDRPYRKRMAPDKVHEVLLKGSGTHFDRLLVQIFLTRSVPSFDQRPDLARLSQALGEGNSPGKVKAVGA
jgi:putative nucleotidyltransferase with HDIG domain